MRLLRSEEAPDGETVDLRTLAALARDWYGDHLDHFFKVWLYTPSKPTSW